MYGGFGGKAKQMRVKVDDVADKEAVAMAQGCPTLLHSHTREQLNTKWYNPAGHYWYKVRRRSVQPWLPVGLSD